MVDLSDKLHRTNKSSLKEHKKGLPPETATKTAESQSQTEFAETNKSGCSSG
jgi:hypothetical protein